MKISLLPHNLLPSKLFERRPPRRRLKLRIAAVQSLEVREMLTITAVDDPGYSTSVSTALAVNAANGVLANDTNSTGWPMYASVVANPSHGSVTLNTNGSFTYTPTTGYSGTDSFTYHDTDGFFWSNTAAATITVGMAAPTAVNDSYSGAHDRTMTIAAGSGVLANDTDPNGLTLSASVVANPSHGTLSLNSNGSFTYTPNVHYVGSDSFTYHDSNGSATSNAATVSLTLTNTGTPGASADSYSVVHDQTLTTTTANGVLANDSDIDGDTLSAVLISGPSHGSRSP